ncbi:vancomycin resistance protein YoaR [Actinoalloteichus hoggarensis]|nr:VanW family protein [Actinoalloteichus hoggarensis]MBB5922636.1 vancomycin resistance protein YoaR [Actinoalloteichus hoggarensis]
MPQASREQNTPQQTPESTSLFQPVQQPPAGPRQNAQPSPQQAESTSLFQPVRPQPTHQHGSPQQGRAGQPPSPDAQQQTQPAQNRSNPQHGRQHPGASNQHRPDRSSDQTTAALSGSLSGSLGGDSRDHGPGASPQGDGPGQQGAALSGSLSGSLTPHSAGPNPPAEAEPERTTTFSPVRDAETTRFEGTGAGPTPSAGQSSLSGRLGDDAETTHVAAGSLGNAGYAQQTEAMSTTALPQNPQQVTTDLNAARPTENFAAAGRDPDGDPAFQGALIGSLSVPPAGNPGSDEPQTVVIPRIDAGSQQAEPQGGLTALFDGSEEAAAAEHARQEVARREADGEPDSNYPMSDAEYARRLSKVKRGGLIAAAAVGVLGLLYGADLMLTSDQIPRGVTVAGVAIGGMDRGEAEERLRTEIGPRLDAPVAVRAGDVETEIDPETAGLTLDWDRTLTQIQDQPLNPFIRLSSFFTSRDVDVVTATDRAALTSTVEALAPEVDREPAEGTIEFEGATPVAVEPVNGQNLDVGRSVDVLYSGWADGRRLDLPVNVVEVSTTSEGIQQALTDYAEPAVSSPVTITGDGKNAMLEPGAIASALSFSSDDEGGLRPELDMGKVTESLAPQLADTEEEGKDAEISFGGGSPTIEPSVDGRGINWENTLETLPDVLSSTDPAERTLAAEYEEQPAEITTEQVEGLGIKEVISTFTTGGFAPDSGINIRQAAQEVNGAIVLPGETFTLNTHTGPRGTAEGYVDAGIIQDGAPGRAVGGGISQFATTLYNAYYFAGLQDNGHQEHSYYISRYPEGREATVFQNPDGSSVIDVGFVNDSDTGVAIQTHWTPSEVTVTIWGTKRYEVESVTGPRTNHTEPQTKEIPEGEPCSPSNGGAGFTVTDTRIIRDLSGNEVRRDGPRSVVYNPQPRIVCGGSGDDGDE